MGRPAKNAHFDLAKSHDALVALLATPPALGTSGDLLRNNLALFEQIHEAPYSAHQVIDALAGANRQMSRLAIAEAVTKIFARMSTEKPTKAADGTKIRTAGASEKPKTVAQQDASAPSRAPEKLAERDALTPAQNATRSSDQTQNKPGISHDTPQDLWGEPPASGC